jgi:hypothetical protein
MLKLKYFFQFKTNSMKKSIPVLLSFCLFIFSCSSSGKTETPESIALQWCDLNGKVHTAAEGTAKETAQAARKKFEEEMKEKFKDNQAMLDNIGKEIEKCENASEGRK